MTDLLRPALPTPSEATTLVELLRARAQASPEARAFTFLRDGEQDAVDWTYATLERRSQEIALALQDAGVRPGDRVVLLYAPSDEYVAGFYGALFAGAIPVPAYPPDPARLQRTLPRLAAIIGDADATMVLTSSDIAAMADFVRSAAPSLAEVRFIATDPLDGAPTDRFEPPDVGAEDLCFLQYTSGSTAAPRGVRLSHRNLLTNCRLMEERLGVTPADVNLFWVPPYHDLGLIGGFVLPFRVGYAPTFMSPVSFLQKPARWLEAVSRLGSTIGGGPTFAYDLAVRKTTPAQRAALDLSRWEIAVVAAEPVRAETLERFAEAFAPAGFRREAFNACYGLAESTLLVTGGPRMRAPVVRRVDGVHLERGEVRDRPDGVALVGCGTALAGQRVCIVDPESRAPLAADVVGEIWASGDSIADGYFGRDDACFGAETSGGEGPFLRTGDLGFLDESGELFVTGRIKDMLLVRGRNLYPQDLEQTTEEAHPRVRPGCVAAFTARADAADEERLAIAFEVDLRDRPGLGPVVDASAIVDAVREAVAMSHGVHVALALPLRAGRIPKTSSGKIQRHAAALEHREGTLELVAGFTPTVAAEPERGAVSGPLARVLSALAAQLEVDAGALDPARSFAAAGLDSAGIVAVAAALDVAPMVFYAHPSPDRLADHLAGASPRPLAAPRPRARLSPIAIVGAACRFPGAPDLESLAALQRRGERAETTQRRFDAEGAAGFAALVDDVARFDPGFFSMKRAEARWVDPQQRVLLELAYQALEHAGLPTASLAGTDAGVFVGVSQSDYGRLIDKAQLNAPLATTGNALSVAANRLSYVFDLHGPSVAVDTACSSSLVAVHLAARALDRGECRVAIAGGVNAILSADLSRNLARARFLSPRGRCSPFGVEADGYVRGEGGGLVVLKRLEDAEADGDSILAVLRGSSVGQSGRGNGLTAPGPQSQARVIRDALRDAGLEPGEVGLVQTHGTGTALGDPVEAMALGDVFSEGREAPLPLGAVKANVGHLESAAGVAGLLSAVLALRDGELPPVAGFTEANPNVDLDALRLAIPSAPMAWVGEPRVAGVSSFGFGGTLAHAVLSSAPSPARAASEAPGPWLFVLSARDEPQLRARAEALADHLERREATSLADLSYTLGRRRDRLRARLAVVAEDSPSLAAALRAGASSEEPAARAFVVDGGLPESARIPRSGAVLSLPPYPFAGDRVWFPTS